MEFYDTGNGFTGSIYSTFLILWKHLYTANGGAQFIIMSDFNLQNQHPHLKEPSYRV